MKRVQCLAGGLIASVVGLPGCWRDAPPDVPEFKAPSARKTAEPAPSSGTPPVKPADAPPAQPAAPPKAPPAEKPAPAAPAQAPAALQAQAPAAPTLIGTWQVVEMARGGQAQPFPPGMTMTLTFLEGGSCTMSMSGGPGGGQVKEGSYVLSGGQLTITTEGRPQSGTLTFEGSDRAVIEIDQTRMTMARQAT